MNEKSKHIELKAGAWYMAGNFINQALAVLLTPILTRMLTKEEYGNFSNFTAWSSMLLVITSLNISNVIVRAKYDYEEDYDEFLSSVSVATIISTSFFYLIIRTFQPWFMKLFDMEIRYINIMFLYLLCVPAYNYFIAQQRVLLKYKVSSVVTVVCSLLTTVLSILLVGISEDRLLGRAIGFVLPPFLLGIVLYGFFIYKGKKVVWSMVKYSLFFSIPLIPHNLSNGILLFSDKILIKKYCSSADVAYYSLGYSIATIVTLFQLSINRAYMPWFYEKLKKEETEGINKITMIMIWMVLAITVGVLLIAPEILFIFGGYKYMLVIEIIPAVIVGCVFQFAFTLYVGFELFLKRTFIISLGTMLAAGANIVLNIILLPRFGYWVAAYTTLIGYAIQFAVHYLIVKRTRYRNVLNNRFIAIIFCSCVLLIPLFHQIYKFKILRWITVAIYILMGIIGLLFGISYLKKERLRRG